MRKVRYLRVARIPFKNPPPSGWGVGRTFQAVLGPRGSVCILGQGVLGLFRQTDPLPSKWSLCLFRQTAPHVVRVGRRFRLTRRPPQACGRSDINGRYSSNDKDNAKTNRRHAATITAMLSASRSSSRCGGEWGRSSDVLLGGRRASFSGHTR